MTEEKRYTESEAERFFAIKYHHKTWDLLDKKDRTPDEQERMVDYAHASLAHWRAAAGSAIHIQRGEWMLARVYTALGETDLALRHAKRCQEILEANAKAMEDFDFAFAYEALARALAASGKVQTAQQWIQRAEAAGNQIATEEDRKAFFDEFNAGDWFGAK